MTNISLANKYRPSTFEEVVGQEHITAILSNISKSQTIPTGLIFVGTAGSGKTTNARIFAKAINCLSETESVCNECENCLAFNMHKSDGLPAYADYYEVDGTTYNGKEDLEQLLDLAARAPVISGGTRVILIDEVHRLSAQAFDVLLKPLEEGLPHTIFLMATTDGDKIRKAILSRCPTFTTKPLSQKKLYGYLTHILDSEQIEYDERSVVLLSYNYAGRTRDAVTEMNTFVSAYNSFKNYNEKSTYEYILDSIMYAYNKDLDSAYTLAKETIAFKTNNIGNDISETILAIYTKNYHIINQEVLDRFLEIIGNNVSKIMSIYLNNSINNMDKFILSLCLVSELNKGAKAVDSKRRLKAEKLDEEETKVDTLIESGKFS